MRSSQARLRNKELQRRGLWARSRHSLAWLLRAWLLRLATHLRVSLWVDLDGLWSRLGGLEVDVELHKRVSELDKQRTAMNTQL